MIRGQPNMKPAPSDAEGAGVVPLSHSDTGG